MSKLKKCQGHKGQRKTEKLLQLEGDPEDMKVNVVHDPDLDPFTVKFIIETSAKSSMGSEGSK